MDKRLLTILCCPVTRQGLKPLPSDGLESLNRAIRRGELRYMDESAVEEELTEALITDNGTRIYRIDDGIPVMLEERSISGAALTERAVR
ncbi:hypothetical protein CKO15_01805 [Halorhodospira abdelmalekii]|nr:hypothetical protein [Halorhodospira abdelmalekii]